MSQLRLLTTSRLSEARGVQRRAEVEPLKRQLERAKLSKGNLGED